MWNRIKDWAIGLTSGLAGVLLTVSVTWMLFQKDLQVTRDISMVTLTRGLTKEFYDNEHIYGDILNSIERCRNLWIKWNGRYNHTDINNYLGFFDDLGFYEKENVIELKFINQVFGTVILETYAYPEIQRYVEAYRESNPDPMVFAHFESLAEKLKHLPTKKALAKELISDPYCPADEGSN